MLKVYHAPKTRGFRVIWLCEELGLPYLHRLAHRDCARRDRYHSLRWIGVGAAALPGQQGSCRIRETI